MQYTIEGSCLVLHADERDKEEIRELLDKVLDRPDIYSLVSAECEALEGLMVSSDLEWIDASETGDLTDAPMIGIRGESGQVEARWAYMEYQVKSFLEDLLEKGKAVLVS